MRKRNFLMAAGACLAALTILAPTALADPPAGTTRALAGVGSLTTDDVMQQMSTVIPTLANYSSNLPGTINTKADIPGSTCDPLPRDGGSTAGVRALIRERAAAAAPNPVRRPCLDWARSSDNSSARAEFNDTGLKYIPFAIDGLTMATPGNSSITTNFPISFLQSLYRCALPPAVQANFRPLLPMQTSGTRSFFLTRLGIPDDGTGFAPPRGTCTSPGAVSDADPTNPTTQLPEHICNRLNNARQLVPHSIAQFKAQSSGAINDDTGTCKMRRIDGIIPDLANAAFPVRRLVFNVIPTRNATQPDLTGFARGTDLNYGGVFVGRDSDVCRNTSIISSTNGFGILNQGDFGTTGCGDATTPGFMTTGGLGPITGPPTP